MPKIEEQTSKPRRALNIFYVLDTSGSMEGTPIGMLNSAMEETVDILKNIAKSNSDALLKIAVLEFNSGCNWVTPYGPEETDDFFWRPLKEGGFTEMGSALKELNSKLDKDEYLKSMTGAYLPVIIFMTDGIPTDDYMKELEKIRLNKWYHRATKIGFAIGEEADKEAIAQIVGNTEAVVATADLELFARLIKLVSTTASMVVSTSSTTGEDVQGGDIVKQVLDNEEDTTGIETIDGKDININLPDDDEFDDDGDGWGNGGW